MDQTSASGSASSSTLRNSEASLIAVEHITRDALQKHHRVEVLCSTRGIKRMPKTYIKRGGKVWWGHKWICVEDR